MIDLADLKDALQIPASFSDHDAYLTGLEKAAVAYAERRTGWYWGPEQSDAVAVLEGDGRADLWLADHASAVSTVVERPYPGGEETTIATGDEDGWVLRIPPGETHGLRLVRKGGFVWYDGYEYEVTYTRGYPAGEEPDDIRQAVTGLVVLWFEQRLPVALGTVAPPVPDHVGAILAAHRKGRV